MIIKKVRIPKFSKSTGISILGILLFILIAANVVISMDKGILGGGEDNGQREEEIVISRVDIPKEEVKGQRILKFKDGTTKTEKAEYLESIDAEVLSEIEALGQVVIKVAEGVEIPESDLIAGSEPDYYVGAAEEGAEEIEAEAEEFSTNDPYFAEQWALKAIDIESIWDEENTKEDSDAVVIAVVDSGVCLDHEDLEGKILENGYDFVENDNVAQDEFDHGCGVAGIIAANIDNEIGIAGVSQNTKILPVRVLDENGVGTYSDVAQGIVYAVDNGAEVINLSLGGYNDSAILKEAVDYAVEKEVKIVAAAGNTGNSTVLYPAKYEDVIAVGAVDESLERSVFSSYGEEIDVWAPGQRIITTSTDGGYKYMSGTSFASPVVGGILKNVDISTSDTQDSITLNIDGNSIIKSLIVGGGDTSISSHPWMIAIIKKGDSNIDTMLQCGGTLIRNKYVLTAAHCFDGFNKDDAQVVVNRTHLDNESEGQRIDIQNIKIHENYNSTTYENDLALVELTQSVNLQAISLNNSQSNETIGQSISILGWGWKIDGSHPSTLQLANTNITEPANCNDIDSKGICIGNGNGVSSYYGDSGGPIFKNNTLIGVISGTPAGYTPGMYSIGSRISYYYGWINDNLPEVHACENFGDGNNIVFYKDKECASDNFEINTPTDGARNLFLFNDSISSIKVRPGWSVRVYEDFGGFGSNRCIRNSMWDLSLDYYTVGDTWKQINETISSVKVYADDNCGYGGPACVLGDEGEAGAMSCDPDEPPPSTGSCPSGNGLYCGSSVGLTSNTLYQCTSGNYQAVQTCTEGCIINPPDVDDQCNGGTVNTCPYGDGLYCGASVGLNTNTLYQCTGGHYQVSQTCESGCQINPPGQSDQCLGSGSTVCPSGNGDYCGSSVGLSSNTLYTCTDGSYAEKQICYDGCQVNPPGTPDICAPDSGAKVKFFGNSEFEGDPWIQVGQGKHNDPVYGLPYKSIDIPDGYSIKLYSQNDQQGDESCWNEDQRVFESTGPYNRIDSVEVFTTDVCPQPEVQGVFLYPDVGFGGTEFSVNQDYRSLSETGIGNDNTRSIKVSGDWHAVLYEDSDYGGQHDYISGPVDDMMSKNIDYRASSIRIAKRVNEGFILYDLGDLHGTEFKSDRTIADLSHWDFNDRARSIKVKSGFEVIVCTDANFHGVCGRGNDHGGTGGGGNVGDYVDIREITNELISGDSPQASSIQVCLGTCPSAPAAPTLGYPQNEASFGPGSTVGFNWTGPGDAFYLELWGGGLTGTLSYGWTENMQWTRSDLPNSTESYYWRVKGWNGYGEGAWSPTYSFTIQDIAPAEVFVFAPDTANLREDVTFYSYVNPTSATNKIYTWSPEPRSGQGTPTAVYNFSLAGQQTVTLNVSNTGGSAQGSFTTNVVCPDGTYMTEYYDNANLAGDPVTYSCEESIDFNWVDQGPNQLAEFGNGSDGDLTVDSGVTVYTDNIRTRLSNAAAINDTSICVDSTAGFTLDDEILIIQSFGAETGTYEYSRITGINNCWLSLRNPLNNSYYTTNSITQIIRVPQYNNLTINGTLTSHSWDGNSGGIVAFKVFGDLLINTGGQINVNGKGYRGAQTRIGNDPDRGYAGEGYTGGYNSFGLDCWGQDNANLNGGGPGHGYVYVWDSNKYASGGGGGGHKYGGQNGHLPVQDGWCHGYGGHAVGDETYNEVFFGGAGASGGAGSNGHMYGGAGGSGGGIILVNSKQITINGSIAANGTNGAAATNDSNNVHKSSGGGGGAGGTILLNAKTIHTNSLVTANGGVGGADITSWGSGGGSGSIGRIKIKYSEELTGTYTSETTVEQLEGTMDNFSIRWTGDIDLQSDIYNFTTNADDGVRLYIDNTLQIDDWIDGYSTQVHQQTLDTGLHEIKLEYYENTGDASVKLNIAPDSNEAPVINSIPGQTIGIDDNFATFDLDNYVSDPEGNSISYTYNGNTDLDINIGADHVVTITKPSAEWYGEETITFIATDQWRASASINIVFKVFECKIGEYKAEYYENKELSGNPIGYSCESEINYDWGNSGPEQIGGFGDGRDGDLQVTEAIIDNPIDSLATGASGQNELQATNSGFQAGQTILIHQTRGIEAGKYEFKKIADYTSGIITTDTPLINTYSTSGNNAAQVIVVKQYNNVTIESTGAYRSKAWDGITGGLLVFFVKGDINVEGSISVSGKGFRGGNGIGSQGQAYTGESSLGINIPAYTANAGGGGGGRGDDYSGGGGGYGESGTNGSTGGGAGGNVGVGGQSYGTANLNNSLHFGSGGGGGAEYNSYGPYPSGGAGSGALIIFAKELAVNGSGSINSNGIDGSGGEGVASGGGAGGSIILNVQTANLGTNVVKANGGNRGTSYNQIRYGGYGGAGRIQVNYCDSITGTTHPVSNNQQITCDEYKDNFSIRWTNLINLEAGDYNFTTYADDGVRLYVDDSLKIDDWIDGYSEMTHSQNLENGLHKITLEYYENTGDASAKLSLAPQSNNPPVISHIPDQKIGINDSFNSFDLDNYISDPEGNSFTVDYSGNTDLAIEIDNNNVVTINKPFSEWSETETIIFTATDRWGEYSSTDVIFQVFECNLDEYYTEYFNNQNLSGDPIVGVCESSIDHDWGTEGPEYLIGYGDGTDGALEVPTGITAYTDNVRMILSNSASVGDTSICVSAASNLSVGDEILIIQSQGTGTGNYEFKRVMGISTCWLSLNEPLNNIYTTTNSITQVIRVPQYTSVTVNGTLTAHPWNGQTGGVLAFRSLGNVIVNTNGKISTDAIGYRGGAGASVNTGGQNGESTDGYVGQGGASGGGTGTYGGGSGATKNNNSPAGARFGGAGSGGYDYYSSGQGDEGTGGGGGGGHATAGGGGGGGGDSYTDGRNGGFSVSAGGGGNGGNKREVGQNGGYNVLGNTGTGGASHDSPDVGTGGGGGGSSIPNLTKDSLYFGSGGGASAAYRGRNTSIYNGKNGGDGGGIIYISGGNIINNGKISSNGESGEGSIGRAGGGGGGAAGSIILNAQSIENPVTNGLETRGGNPGGVNAAGGGGGNGGDGKIYISFCDSYSGNSYPASANEQTSCQTDNFSVKWTGFMNVQEEKYKFILQADDGTRLYIDDNLVIDNWTDSYSEQTYSQNISEGLHEIKLEYYENTENAQVHFLYEPAPSICESVIGIPQSECNALETFYNETNGDNWTNHTGWLETNEPCSWFGIYCSNGHIDRLYLPSNNLSGTIPADIQNLTELKYLQLMGNNLTGQIPAELGNLTKMKQLELYSNHLSGTIPPELGSLSNLTKLIIHNNPDLGGTIPTSLGSLSNLEYLYLGMSNVEGEIPPELGNLSKLKRLDLRESNLTGTIPNNLGNLSNLTTLYLQYNSLEGTIPEELGDLTLIQDLRLEANKLEGPIPDSMSNFTNLTSLNLAFNMLWIDDSQTDLQTFLNVHDSDWMNTQTIAPSNVSATKTGDTSVSISWDIIPYTSDIGYYEVMYSTTSGTYNTVGCQTANKSASSCEVQNLNPSETYYFAVRTFTQNHGGQIDDLTSSFSEEAEFIGREWTYTANLPSGRRQASVTELNNGEILVAGGLYSGSLLNDCYLYNPNNNTWTQTGSMNTARNSHTAVKLLDGRIFVAGGGSDIASAEIYDPNTRTWTNAGALSVGRYSHTANLLANGRVIIIGGFASGSYDAPTEIYDPVTGTWSTGASPAIGRGEHQATTLNDGRILLTGGYRGNVVAATEIYNPTTDSWTTLTSMNQARTRHSATLLSNGEILVAGGWIGNMLNSAEIYDPNTNTWTNTPNMAHNHSDQTAEIIGSKIFIIGGSPANDTSTEFVEIYDADTNTWSTGPSMNEARRWHTSIIFSNNTIFVVGGTNSTGNLDTAEKIIW